MEPVDLALVDSAVRLAVADEVERSRVVREEAETSWWTGTLAEVRRLRRLTSQQAARIAELERQLAEARAELSRVELEDLLRSITQSVAEATQAMEGYAVSEARVEVRAAVQLASGRMLLTSDPAALLQPEALSSIGVSVHALPPPVGQPAQAPPG